MKPLKPELKIGLLFGAGAVMAVMLAWIIGFQNPFQARHEFYVTYNFAGGIEVGSPVRISGIKAGRVEAIEFFTAAPDQIVSQQEPGSPLDDPNEKALVPVRVRVSVQKDAAVGIRHDSKFYINLAGIIGERYIEVTPGTKGSPRVDKGMTVIGVDPPRIDQLLSQSFALAGKIQEIIEENKGDLGKSIELLYKLSGNLNKTLQWVDKSGAFKGDLSKLIDNLIVITTDVRRITEKTNSPEGQKTLKLLYDLLWRLEPMDAENIRKFLQKEGIRARLF